MCEKCDLRLRTDLRAMYPEMTSEDIENMVANFRDVRENGRLETAAFAPVVNQILDRHGHGSKGFAIALTALAATLGMTIAKLPRNMHQEAYNRAGGDLIDALRAFEDTSPPDDGEADDMLRRVEQYRLSQRAGATETRH